MLKDRSEVSCAFKRYMLQEIYVRKRVTSRCDARTIQKSISPKNLQNYWNPKALSMNSTTYISTKWRSDNRTSVEMARYMLLQ